MNIPVPFGGSGGDGSDDCTAVAADILKSKTAIYSGSDDEAANGSMNDYSGTTTSVSPALDTSNSRVTMTIPNTGKYDTSAKLYASYSTMRSLIGLDASKIATGNSILGVSGTYTGIGTAGTSQVLSGYTFSSNSLSGASGAMSNRGNTATSVTAVLDSSNSRVRMTIPNSGYYDTSAYLYTSYSSLASVISLTAAKLGYGKTCLGITGTYKPTVKNITAMAYRGFGLSSSNYVTSEEASYTCPAAGNCYYGGIAAFYNASGNGTCEIYKNGTLQNSRNSGEGYVTRTTMYGQSFSVAAGDVIKVSCTATSGTHVLTWITADIVCYE